MTVVVFAGPSLSRKKTPAASGEIYLPPAARGDIYQAAQSRPLAICLVDGYFERVPSVWHKEILWAMSEGIHVFGSASLGALRAAELEAFGMVGVGRIFESFRDEDLEDDDEVAVLHGPAELGYPPVTDAMVNIRATLHRAANAGVIGNDTCARLEQLGKAQFFHDRSFARLIAQASMLSLPQSDLAALELWLPGNKVDQKREDAELMLRVMREHLDSYPGPKQVRYRFQRTAVWEALVRSYSDPHPFAD